MRKANNHICRRNHGRHQQKKIELLKLRETENHTLEDRQADHQKGGRIAGCRRRKELLKAGKTG